MLNLDIIQSIVTTLLLLGAYAVSSTLAEAGQAWLAWRMGDDSALRNGWGSLNPLNHVDIIGALTVSLLGFGWVRPLPMDSAPLRSAFGNVRLILVYLAQAIINIMLACGALTMLVLCFGGRSLAFAFSMFISNHAPLSSFATMYPDHSSFAIVSGLFLIALVTYSTFIASIGLIAHGFRYVMMWLRTREKPFLATHIHDENVLWVSVFILLIFFTPPLRAFLFQVIARSVMVVGHMVGKV